VIAVLVYIRTGGLGDLRSQVEAVGPATEALWMKTAETLYRLERVVRGSGGSRSPSVPEQERQERRGTRPSAFHAGGGSMDSVEERGGLGRALRNVAIVAVVVFAALVAGFGVGYYFRDKRVQELEQLMTSQKEQVTSMERKVWEAQKTQLERALARAKLNIGFEEMVGSLAAAQAEVEQKNFGRAMQKIAAAKGALSAVGDTPAAAREALGSKLDEIKAGLEQLDVKVRDQISSLAKDLEAGTLPGASSKERGTPGSGPRDGGTAAGQEKEGG
jgi:hypothetical protein